MLLLLGLLSVLCGEPGLSLQDGGEFTFDGRIRQFAVSDSSVYAATEERLYHLNHDLSLASSLTQRGFLNNLEFYRVSEKAAGNATFHVNVLLPFGKNNSLIVCGVISECYCEVLDPKNISKLVYKEPVQVGPRKHSQGSLSLLVDVRTRSQTDTYILTAVENKTKSEIQCSLDYGTVNLHNTNKDQTGDIFSVNEGSTTVIKNQGGVDFVDGFQINSTIYLLSNVLSENKNKIRLIWFKAETSKSATLKSLRGATLTPSDGGDGGSRLVASSLIPGGQQVLWSGVFSVDGDRNNTELLVFDISPDLSRLADDDPHFSTTDKFSLKTPKTLKPEAVISKQNNITAVLAVKKRGWMVFFIGTGDGQLFKIAVDRNYHPACPTVLHVANDDRQVFPKLHLDPVDQKHVYLPFRNQMIRVPVSNCSTHTTLHECWSAQDPFCVWCGSKKSCTFEDDCKGSDWLSIPDEFQQKMVSHKVELDKNGQITLSIQIHMTWGTGVPSNFACQFSTTSGKLCSHINTPAFPQCSCIISNEPLPANGLKVSVKYRLEEIFLDERLMLTNCSEISGSPNSALCRRCIEAGCGWSKDGCSWANQGETNVSVCQNMDVGMNFSKPEITSITPSVVSFYGRNNAVLAGFNLRNVTKVRIQADVDCPAKESPVWNQTDTRLMFHIPGTDTKGTFKACAVLSDGTCHGAATITYQSSPSCTDITPKSSWYSGMRNITLTGSYLELVEGVSHSDSAQQKVKFSKNPNQSLIYETPAAEDTEGTPSSHVFLKVANQTLPCPTKITYYPEPKFTSFTPTRKGNNVLITIQKKADPLEMTTAELSVSAVKDGKERVCRVNDKKTSNDTDSFTCEIENEPNTEFQLLMIKYGGKEIELKNKQHGRFWLFIVLVVVLLLIPCIIIVGVVLYRKKQRRLTDEMNRLLDDLELNIRNDIRQGFVDLQTEKAELLENVGAIPFLDYKHFASKIFFPESESMTESYVKDIGQDVVKIQLDECCQGLSRLIQDQKFLTSMVHALEEQKSFSIKDKCALASLLTVALHSNLSYLTEVMEVLLKDLMQQSSNAQPKLLLRRTESTVEKLLTNWMSICLYGFLRETVGQHLFLMVSALTQQIEKGPVDCVTEKALYTLSEDWLLWQAQDFSPLKLKVLFAVGSDGEVSEPLEVSVLSCDTVEQVKKKILSTFKAKFGFPYSITLRDACIEYEKDGSFIPLEEVDQSSEVIGEVTMLNTLKRYKVNDGATVKVLSRKNHPPLSPQGSLKDDENFSGKYFHLIDPDVVEDQRKNQERKKLKLKEVHLTKLLSTKVAVHSFVENLFRSIWGTEPKSKAPNAIKYFFDFLDAQADNMKITDPDVLHIWKTNSLPLRFWVNILKNPQFVFDMEKSPHLDGCLSVIAQAFMDSFSLTDTQLGKHAPTNKLLYAKEIPKFKQEVKVYYKQIREQPPITDGEFRDFLLQESKKHENEFNETAALKELYKFIRRYFTEIKEKLDQNGAPAELKEQLQHVKDLFDGLKSCSWN